MCSSDFLVNTTLVGGAWPNSSLCGLWCWIVHNISSNTWESNGARLLMCRDLMCRFRCWLYALVGGRFADLSLCCGLWYWTLSYLSSNTHAHIGARPLICRDLMCRFRCLPRDLSAALMLTPLGVVCGVGI